MARDDEISETAEWHDINDITSQLVGMMDALADPDPDHVMARRALARTIACIRADKSAENDAFFNSQVARQLVYFRLIDAGILA
ncbi:MAG: hypothetical protein JW839_09760 [Candidatus Lokiarchaeota archaeon]|nr:hypothetical protein [Candidatus Lokiarchaeota archaeon]